MLPPFLRKQRKQISLHQPLVTCHNMSLPCPFFKDEFCAKALAYPELIQKLTHSMRSYSRGEVEQPVRATLQLKDGFFGMMPCYSSLDNAISCKLVMVKPNNACFGQPSHIAHLLLLDAASGDLKAIMEAEAVTERRTAAASALSAKFLAKPNPEVVGILGSGHQARSHAIALIRTFSTVKELNIWNHRKSNAEKLADELRLTFTEISIRVHDNVKDCVRDSDLIATTTFAQDPVLLRSYIVKKDVHIMAVGAARPTMSEMDPDLMHAARVFVDSRSGASVESGDIVRSGCKIEAEIGEVIDNQKNFAKGGITIYKSLGMAVQDMISACMIDEANRSLLNTSIDGGTLKYFENKQVKHVLEKDSGELHIKIADKESEKVETQVNSDRVRLALMAKSLDDRFIICNVRCCSSITDDQCEKISLILVYEATNGKLLGVVDTKSLSKDVWNDEIILNLLLKLFSNEQ